jgi:hypothetical protein
MKGILMLTCLTELTAVMSHFLNVITCGSRFYSFSARAHYCAQYLVIRKWVYIEIVIDTIYFWQVDHCENQYSFDKQEGKKPL